MLKHLLWFPLAMVFAMALPGRSSAEQIRFRYVPVNACGQTQQVPIGPEGAIGERLTGLGVLPKPFRETLRPTHMVTFRHPFNQRNVTVPLTLPQGAPRLVYQSDRITYHYADHWIVVHFLPDGSVDVIYHSGLMRPLKV